MRLSVTGASGIIVATSANCLARSNVARNTVPSRMIAPPSEITFPSFTCSRTILLPFNAGAGLGGAGAGAGAGLGGAAAAGAAGLGDAGASGAAGVGALVESCAMSFLQRVIQFTFTELFLFVKCVYKQKGERLSPLPLCFRTIKPFSLKSLVVQTES